MNIELKKYNEQIVNWPKSGYHIMAQYDDEKILVYQSYKKEIGDFAVKNQFFGGEFSMERMTWIKPNFLWMMYRNGWGTKEGQESVLAIHLRKEAFENYLRNAVYSSFNQTTGINQEEWQEQVKTSNVRLQWDPDHDPYGMKLERRAIQIGLRNEFIRKFSKDDIILIQDISDFVSQQHHNVINNQLDNLIIPLEKPLIFDDMELNKMLKILI
jgi:hypothetical protein